MNRPLRIATRKSPLALWQAEYVKNALQAIHPELEVELVLMTTQGDKLLDTPLANIGGKGLFVKELEVALLEGQADIAVHSIKDVPMIFPEGLDLVAICERENPADALVSSVYPSIDALPQGAKVGTSSLRRRCQLQYLRPDLNILDCRGNVNTRLAKLDAGDYDALILASAGLIRLGLNERIQYELPLNVCLPACGQGAIGIEARSDDATLLSLLEDINHPDTWVRIAAERAMNKQLEGGCQVPIAGHAVLSDGYLHLEGRVGAIDGSALLKAMHSIPFVIKHSQLTLLTHTARDLGQQVADHLLSQGAKELMAMAQP
jgi:hydroxymethylbilane synthase